jgi:predicted HicB family RNase H-like nuclease
MSEFQQQPVTHQNGIVSQPQPTTPAQSTSTPAAPHSAIATQVPPAGQPITRRQEVCRVANEMFRQNPDWVTFFREVLGVEGVARRIFKAPEEMEAFEQTDEYTELQAMVAKLREKSRYQSESNEPTRVITVRLPKSLHEALKAESHQRCTSMNQLCISKLLQIIDNELVPAS